MTTEYAGMSFVIAIALMITVLVIVIIWQGSKIAQTKMKVAAEVYKEESFRQLAEDAVTYQQQISENLSDLKTRVAAIEKMLSEV
ncbi:hypothetical protein ASZ90_019308 [hydrocarbon metagenome]|uniref:Uncharacterized protein n=1 Tax=hydrocarbon metagenome TaxID=938273 RepID=A0A0W8E406_9ZZZZ